MRQLMFQSPRNTSLSLKKVDNLVGPTLALMQNLTLFKKMAFH